jgi:hypothetical protein
MDLYGLPVKNKFNSNACAREMVAASWELQYDRSARDVLFV